MLNKLFGYSLTSRLWFATTAWLFRSVVVGSITTSIIVILLLVVGWRPELSWSEFDTLLALFIGLFAGTSLGSFLRDAEVGPVEGEEA